jgi:uncharacterized protein
MKTNDIFYGSDRKLRSGWRFGIFAATYLFVSTIVAIVVFAILQFFNLPRAAYFLFGSISSMVLATFLNWFFGKYLEDLPFRALGVSMTKGWSLRFLLGAVFGAVTLGISAFVAIVFGGLDFQINPNYELNALVETLAWSFMIFLFAGAFEEVLFRGFILQTFIRSGLPWFGVVLSSILFASVHLANKNATAFAVFNTFVAGIWFAAAYYRTRDLWLPIGMHLMWNWVQGAILGVEVSGMSDIISSPLLKEIDRGPMWLTGENYGIEGGIASTVALLVSTIAIFIVPFLRPSEEMMKQTEPPA